MMGVTHALIGLFLGLTSIAVLPSFQLVAATAAMIGGLFPDLDLLFNHRKTLHFPVIYSSLAFLAFVVVLLSPSTVSIAAFYFLFSASVHSWMDIFGGGLEEKPWIPSSDRAVYSLTLDRWFAPKRWIRYDGAPEDLLFSILLAAPCYILYESQLLKTSIIILLAVGGLYVLVRKKMVDWAPEWIKEIFS